jgi:hypothetical protein
VTLKTLGDRETAFVVDLATAKIVRKITGSTSGQAPGSIEQGLSEMKARLGLH